MVMLAISYHKNSQKMKSVKVKKRREETTILPRLSNLATDRINGRIKIVSLTVVPR